MINPSIASEVSSASHSQHTMTTLYAQHTQQKHEIAQQQQQQQYIQTQHYLAMQQQQQQQLFQQAQQLQQQHYIGSRSVQPQHPIAYQSQLQVTTNMPPLPPSSKLQLPSEPISNTVKEFVSIPLELNSWVTSNQIQPILLQVLNIIIYLQVDFSSV